MPKIWESIELEMQKTPPKKQKRRAKTIAESLQEELGIKEDVAKQEIAQLQAELESESWRQDVPALSREAVMRHQIGAQTPITPQPQKQQKSSVLDRALAALSLLGPGFALTATQRAKKKQLQPTKTVQPVQPAGPPPSTGEVLKTTLASGGKKGLLTLTDFGKLMADVATGQITAHPTVDELLSISKEKWDPELRARIEPLLPKKQTAEMLGRTYTLPISAKIKKKIQAELDKWWDEKAALYEQAKTTRQGLQEWIAEDERRMARATPAQKLIYQVGSELPRQLGQIAVAGISESLIPLGLQAAAETMASLEEQGVPYKERLLRSVASGLIEAGTERLSVPEWIRYFKGIGGDRLIKEGAQEVAQQGFKTLGQWAKRAVMQWAKGAAGEVGEELIADPLHNLADILILGEQKPIWTAEQAGETALQSGVMSLILGALGLPSQYKSYQMAKQMLQQNKTPTAEQAEQLHKQIKADTTEIGATKEVTPSPTGEAPTPTVEPITTAEQAGETRPEATVREKTPAPGEAPLPEAPATLSAQIGWLQEGKRKAVLVTPGETMPEVPKGVKTLKTAKGTFLYRPDLIKPKEITQAITEDRIGDVLGYGIPRKPPLEKIIGAVTIRGKDGVEKLAVVTDQEHLDQVMARAKELAGPEDTVALEEPTEVVRKRIASAPISQTAKKEPWEMTKAEWENQAKQLSTQYQQILTQETKETDPNSPAFRQAEQRALTKLRKITGRQDIDSNMLAGMGHKAFVRDALAKGKLVPPEVLKDYPDLKPIPKVGPVAVSETVPTREPAAIPAGAEQEAVLRKSPVYTDIRSKLMEVKPPNIKEKDWDKYIDRSALLWAAHAATESSRRGISVEEWYQGANRPEIRNILNQSIEEPAGRTLYQYAGEQAQTADPLKLTRAKALKAAGMSNERIRLETGWFQGMDGKWRFIIVDSDAKMAGMGAKQLEASSKKFGEVYVESKSKVSPRPYVRLADVLDHPMLYKAYPWLQALHIEPQNEPGAAYSTADGTIRINKDMKVDKAMSSLMHEIQHAIQEYEGFARGGSLAMAKELQDRGLLSAEDLKKEPEEIYLRHAGEIEARDTAKMWKYNKMWRDLIPPETRPNAIVVFRGKAHPYLTGAVHEYAQEGSRARVTISQVSSVISLMAKADRSSFIHESAHIWLEDMFSYVRSGQADEAYIRQWKPAALWLGIKEGQTELTRKQHEKFARGFEAYMREGKAPSTALQRVFEAFKQWLSRIYRTAAELNADINDDIRSFFDRMFATEAEIAEAKGKPTSKVASVSPAKVVSGTRIRLKNGAEHTVREVLPNGNIVIEDGTTLGPAETSGWTVVETKEVPTQKPAVTPKTIAPKIGGTYTVRIIQSTGSLKEGQEFTGKVNRIFRVKSGAVLAELESADGTKRNIPVSKYAEWREAKEKTPTEQKSVSETGKKTETTPKSTPTAAREALQQRVLSRLEENVANPPKVTEILRVDKGFGNQITQVVVMTNKSRAPVFLEVDGQGNIKTQESGSLEAYESPGIAKFDSDDIVGSVEAALLDKAKKKLENYKTEIAKRGTIKSVEQQAAERVTKAQTAGPPLGVIAGRQLGKRQSRYAFSDPEVEARWQAAKGIPPKKGTLVELITDFWHKATREFEHLPKTAEFSPIRNQLLNLEKQRGVVMDKTLRRLQDIVLRLDADDFDLFTRAVVMDDLAASLERNEQIPFWPDKESFQRDKDAIDKAVMGNMVVQEALKKRREHWDEVKQDYIKAMEAIGFNVKDRLTRSNYFHHQVLEYARAQSIVSGTGKRLKTPTGRGFLKKRTGEYTGDINVDYLQAETEVMAQMIHDIEVAKTIKLVMDRYNIADQVKAEAKEKELDDWRKAIPEGYILWQPRQGSVFYFIDSIPAKLAEQLKTGALEELGITVDDLRQVLAVGGPRKELVIKEELAKTLDDLTKPPEGPLAKAASTIMGGWKIWQLFSPKRFFKYEARNLSGDADHVFVGNPSAFKKVPRAISELFKIIYKDAGMTPEMRSWFERGGMQSTLFAQEISDVNKLKIFERFLDEKSNFKNLPARMVKAYWNAIRGADTMREAILRYAAYLDYLEQMKNDPEGKPKNFGASDRSEIMTLESLEDRAYKLSNDLLGAYDQVSVVGQYLRRRTIPFWSWNEVNFRIYKQLLINAAKDGKAATSVGRALGITIPKTAYKVGKFAIKAAGFWAILNVWNYLFFRDEEEELPEEVRRKPHIIFGRDKEGKILYFSRLGAVADFVEWFGLDDPVMMVKDFLNGQKTIKEIAVEMAKQPAIKITQGLSPFIKVPFEVITGKKLYPDLFRPGTIRDPLYHIADSLGIKDEYIAIKGLPAKGGRLKGYLDSWRNAYMYRADPDEIAYWIIMDRKFEFQRKRGKGGSGFSPVLNPKSNALYNLKLAIKYEDKEAMEKYLLEYAQAGGTVKGLKQSLATLHPLYGIREDELADFLKWLTAEDQRALIRALKYYKDLLTIPPVAQIETNKSKK